MDINFHYYAVKTVARSVGFTEANAQRIASFSQFIDDFNRYSYMIFTNIPTYIIDDPLCDLCIKILVWRNYVFNPATTGFTNKVDYGLLLANKMQNFTVSPFHFIPDKKWPVADRGNLTQVQKTYNVKPAVIGDGSLIDQQLRAAIRTYNTQIRDGQSVEDSLMHIGMLLHVFADTYAHQGFSGFQSWVNDVVVLHVFNNITQEDETEKRKEIIAGEIKCTESKRLKNFMQMGHGLAGHLPDLSHLSFTLGFRSNERSSAHDYVYTRSNTSTFVNAALQIARYLRTCDGRNAGQEMDRAALRQGLKNGFLISDKNQKNKETLENHWKANFPAYTYSYDKNDIFNRFGFLTDESWEGLSISVVKKLLSGMYHFVPGYASKTFEPSPEFYRYNHYAYQLLIALYGTQPRKRKIILM